MAPNEPSSTDTGTSIGSRMESRAGARRSCQPRCYNPRVRRPGLRPPNAPQAPCAAQPAKTTLFAGGRGTWAPRGQCRANQTMLHAVSPAPTKLIAAFDVLLNFFKRGNQLRNILPWNPF